MGFRVPSWGSQSITVQFFTSDVLGDCGPTAFRSLTSSSSVVLGWSTTFITISWCTELETEGDDGHLIFLLLSALCRSTVFSLTSFDSSLDLLDRCAVYTFMVVIDQSLIRQSVGVRILAGFFFQILILLKDMQIICYCNVFFLVWLSFGLFSSLYIIVLVNKMYLNTNFYWLDTEPFTIRSIL